MDEEVSTTREADDRSQGPLSFPIFANGGVYVFDSDSSNLVTGDTNGSSDVFQSEFIPPGPGNSALCGVLKKKLTRFKAKLKKAKRSKNAALAKSLKKKIKKLTRQLKVLGC